MTARAGCRAFMCDHLWCPPVEDDSRMVMPEGRPGRLRRIVASSKDCRLAGQAGRLRFGDLRPGAPPLGPLRSGAGAPVGGGSGWCLPGRIYMHDVTPPSRVPAHVIQDHYSYRSPG